MLFTRSVVAAAVLAGTAVALPVKNCIGSTLSPVACDSPDANSINVANGLGLDPEVNILSKVTERDELPAVGDVSIPSVTKRQDLPVSLPSGLRAREDLPLSLPSGFPVRRGLIIDPVIKDVTGSARARDLPVSIPSSLPKRSSVNPDIEDESIEGLDERDLTSGGLLSPAASNSPGANSINLLNDLDVEPEINVLSSVTDSDDSSASSTKSPSGAAPSSSDSDSNAVGGVASPVADNSPGANSINALDGADVSPDVNLLSTVEQGGSDSSASGSWGEWATTTTTPAAATTSWAAWTETTTPAAVPTTSSWSAWTTSTTPTPAAPTPTETAGWNNW